jgi:hypothetical protein
MYQIVNQSYKIEYILKRFHGRHLSVGLVSTHLVVSLEVIVVCVEITIDNT